MVEDDEGRVNVDADKAGKMPGDSAPRFSPISFALAFVIALRKRSDLSQLPSVRTTIALPRFLSARALRTGRLTARDYVEAAVLLTPPEDQGTAFEVARELLFPREHTAEAKEAVAVVNDSAVVATSTTAPAQESSLLSDLASLDLGALDFGNLDLAALDSLLDQKSLAATEMKALDLMTTLSASSSSSDQSLLRLAGMFGGAAALEADGVADVAGARRHLLQRLHLRLGELDPESIGHAGHAGFAAELLDDVDTPWERAGLLAASGQNDEELRSLLEEILAGGGARDAGRTLRFLRADPATLQRPEVESFSRRALDSASHLAEWADILEGLGAFVPPSDELVRNSAVENLPRALAAASALENAFSMSLGPTVFDAWADSLSDDEVPDLDFLVGVCVPGSRWEALVQRAFDAVQARLVNARTTTKPELRAELTREAVAAATALKGSGTAIGRKLSAALSTEVLLLVVERSRFLPMLDALIDLRLLPNDAKAVVEHGTSLGVDERAITSRLALPLEQLRWLIEGNLQDLARHLDLVDKLPDGVPAELLAELIACCVRDQNRMGLALLLAIALGPTLQEAPAQLCDDSLGFKGIGGGENLLLQWYTHRESVPDAFKARVKALAHQALLDAALVWMHKGTGGAEQGLIPQARSRPYRAGDELDSLDIEGTLEALVVSGKPLEQMGEEDLVVSETSSGRAGFGVLIDISGSMSGKDLAVCAIAVVMLLGRLRAEEVAIALFESNTHVIKTFDDATDLDSVCDALLDLAATGGTCVDAALKFMAEQFGAQAEQERRVLFLLSDFCFFEDQAKLQPLLWQLRELDVRFLGAAHGHIDKDNAALFVEHLEGQVAKLASLAKLPETLLQTLAWIAA